MTLPSNQWTIAISLIAHWLCYFNSAVNPVIYNFMSGKNSRRDTNTTLFNAMPNVTSLERRHVETKICNPAGFILGISWHIQIYTVIFSGYRGVYKITECTEVTSIKMHDVSEVRNARLPLFQLLLIHRAKLCSSR